VRLGGFQSLDMSKEDAAKCRALLNRPMSAIVAAISDAVIGPTPEIAARRGAVRSGISTETGADIRPTAKAGSDRANASMCCTATTAAVNTVQMVQIYGCDSAGGPRGRNGPHDLIRRKIYATFIVRVALTGSFSTLQSADRFASPRTYGNRRSTPRPHKFFGSALFGVGRNVLTRAVGDRACQLAGR
jgi:hypothetical protein